MTYTKFFILLFALFVALVLFAVFFLMNVPNKHHSEKARCCSCQCDTSFGETPLITNTTGYFSGEWKIMETSTDSNKVIKKY